MSWLNYILVIISIGALVYSYSVGSTFGVAIWIIVFFLNLALIIVEKMKKKAMARQETTPPEEQSQ
jgi:hypothetical protein